MKRRRTKQKKNKKTYYQNYDRNESCLDISFTQHPPKVLKWMVKQRWFSIFMKRWFSPLFTQDCTLLSTPNFVRVLKRHLGSVCYDCRQVWNIQHLLRSWSVFWSGPGMWSWHTLSPWTLVGHTIFTITSECHFVLHADCVPFVASFSQIDDYPLTDDHLICKILHSKTGVPTVRGRHGHPLSQQGVTIATAGYLSNHNGLGSDNSSGNRTDYGKQ